MPWQRACSGIEQTTGALHVPFLHFYNNMTDNKPKSQRQRNSIFFHGSLQINGFVHMLWAWERYVYEMAVLVEDTLPDDVIEVHR